MNVLWVFVMINSLQDNISFSRQKNDHEGMHKETMTSLSETVSFSCLKTCSNTLKSSIASIIGNNVDMQLLAPFHSIIGKSRSILVANRKVSWLCYSIKRFDECAKKCPHTKSKALRMAVVQQWNTICDASKKEPKVFTEFLSCERHHYEITSPKCTSMKITLETPLNEFCEQLYKYAQCYNQVPYECSMNGTEIWKQINRSIRKSYALLLDLSAQHLNIPQTCKLSIPSDFEDSQPPVITTTTKKPSTRLFVGWHPEYQYKTSKSAMDDYWVDLGETTTWPSTMSTMTTTPTTAIVWEQSKNSVEYIEWHDFTEGTRKLPRLRITTPTPTTRRISMKTQDFIKTTIINPRKTNSNALNQCSKNFPQLPILIILLIVLKSTLL